MTTLTLQAMLDERQRLDQLIQGEQKRQARQQALQDALSRHRCHIRKRRGASELVIQYPYWNGYRSVIAPAADEDSFRDDPSGYLATYFNVTRQQYQDWHADKHEIQCGGYTEAGIPCRAMVRGPYSESPAHWVEMRGKVFCHFHDPDGSHQSRKREAQRRAESEATKPRLGGISAVARTLGISRHRLRKIEQSQELSAPFPKPQHNDYGHTDCDYWDLDEVSKWWKQLREDERSLLGGSGK